MPAPSPNPNPNPNIVLILTDTQGANMVGAYGHPGVETPCIDRLAARGTLFRRAYTTCPLCTPARAALFTGIYAHTAGAWTNNLPLGDNVKTLGQRFRDLGYHTAYIGKWHLDGHDYFGSGICPDGWDERYWYDGRRYLDELTDAQIDLWRRGLSTPDDLRRHDIQPEFTWARRVSNRAMDFLDRRDGRPFLLVVSYDEPHHPYACPPGYAARFERFDYPLGAAAFDDLANKPEHQREWAESLGLPPSNGFARHPMYFGCNSFVDSEIGRVIDAVHRAAPDYTCLICTSDHGDMLGAHHLAGKGPVMYDEITRVPLIVEQPGGLAAGQVNDTLVSHADLLPTLLHMAGAEPPDILEGQSIKPLLDGRSDPDRAVLIEFNRYEIEHDSWGGFQPVRCLVAGRYKLVINLLSTDELYDLSADPAEVDNLIDRPDAGAAREELHDRLLAWMDDKRDPFRGPAWERRPWRSRRRMAWRGKFRPRPPDGYAPVVRDYDTGMPSRGVKVEYGARPAR